jgi:hypothetical protein
MKNFRPPKEYDIAQVLLFLKTKNVKDLIGAFRWGQRNTPQGYHFWSDFYHGFKSGGHVTETKQYRYTKTPEESVVEWE